MSVFDLGIDGRKPVSLAASVSPSLHTKGIALKDTHPHQAEMVGMVEPLIPALRRYARMLSKDKSAADDLVQDCLERTFTRWHLLRSNGNIKAWIFSILHNLAMSQFRRVARRGQHMAIEDIDESVFALPPAQEDALNHHQVLAAIDRLPEEYRSVFLLIAVEELSYAEAASVLDIPLGTVMSRLYRARMRLQSDLSHSSIPPVTQNLRVVK